MKKVLGLIGKPVEHSLSPLMQNWLIRKNDLNYTYLSFEVKSGEVKPALMGARVLDFGGLNVTIPHKSSAAGVVDKLGEKSRMIGAVNTVEFFQGNLIGRNTDITGFLRSLQINGFRPSGKRCFLFGAGGGAAAVSFGLATEGAERLFIANRTVPKAKKLANKVEKVSNSTSVEALGLDDDLGEVISGSGLVVNATPLGTWPRVDQAIWKDPSAFSPGQLVYDLVYNPPRTKFLNLAEAGGANTVSGLDMLICQGIESLGIWTDREFEVEEYLEDLKNYLQESLN